MSSDMSSADGKDELLKQVFEFASNSESVVDD